MADLSRYSRHMVMPQVQVNGQELLLDSHVLVIGAGGLGSAAALYLAAAGVGRLTIADGDRVDLSNLQRQILHREADVGRLKAESAADTLGAINTGVTVEPLAERLDEARLTALADGADVVVDASDNFPTRFAVNRACIAARRPLVSGAAIRLEGQLAVFEPGVGKSPCYRCLYAEEGEAGERCEDAGVLGPLVGVIGSLQALETIKLLLGLDRDTIGRLATFDAERGEWRRFKAPRDPACPDCGG